MLREYAGVPEPALRRHPALREGRRRPDPAQARGPQPHRRPQDPQRARPGAAHQADGQDPGDRRDRRRPARRRDRHRGGVLRPRLRRLHGRGRHQAAGAQRGPDAAARRRGRPGRLRQRAPSRTPSTRRCATGSPPSTTRPTSSAPPPARTRSRRMVRDFTRGIGDEARAQCLELTGRLPDAIAACVGGGSNAIGLFTAFLDDPDVRHLRLRGRRRRRRDRAARRDHHAPATVGVLHGARTFVLQDEDGQTIESHSISAGLDYPGVGPQHAYLAESGRADYLPITDAQAMDALALLARTEGIIPRHRVRARAGRRLRRGRASSAPTGWCWSTCPAAATRTWSTAVEWFGLGERRRRRVTPDARASARAFDEGPRGRAAPRWSATCRPASPTSQGGIDALTRDGRRRLRRHRGRAALQRPGHGRPDDPGRRPAGAGARASAPPTCSAPSRRSPPPASRPW